MTPAKHSREDDRLAELARYGILDTEREAEFDEIVELASRLCGTPVSVVNFIDRDRQWFKAETGLGVRSTPLDTSLCGHAILQDDFVEIPDTLLDTRMADNPLCLGEQGFRFYAGALLKGADGLPLGTLCVLDRRPRVLDDTQRRVLEVLARQVMRELDLRLALEREKVLRREVDHRVKNSLASIAAILSMKARRAATTEVREALEDVGVRIRSLASLHAELHQIGDGQTVNVAQLFSRVATDLQQLLPDGLRLTFDVDDGRVSPELANALLLVVNEFVSNSSKHGFPVADGEISVRIAFDATGWTLACHDNGIADDAAVARAATSSGLGTRVIRALADSMSASLHWHAREPGIGLKMGGQVRA